MITLILIMFFGFNAWVYKSEYSYRQSHKDVLILLGKIYGGFAVGISVAFLMLLCVRYLP